MPNRVVISYQRQEGRVEEKPYIFRTYKNLHRGENAKQRLLDRNPGLAHDIPIWQVARATSAAPTYFEPPKTGDLEYLDGGMGANNPCEEIYDEVRRMNNGSKNCVRVILSIGTGRNHKTARFSGEGISRYWNYLNWAKKWATDSQEAHLRMLKTQEWESERFHYFRLDVEEGLDDMKLDEWRVRGTLRTTIGQAIKSLRSFKKSSLHTINDNKARSDKDSAAEKTDSLLYTSKPLPESTVPAWFQPKNMTLDSIRAKTKSYLEGKEVQTELQECAKILVNIRRIRGRQDPQRWERACFGTWYQCRVAGCQRGEKEYDRREALMNHLKHKHSDSFRGTAGWDLAKLNETLDKFKIIVR
ncbi:hypothetical protein MMC29_005964 [Sticta canariensis]|nr:hypothetical protein [Sticta canariensis]